MTQSVFDRGLFMARRLARFANVPALIQHLKFLKLRETYNRNLWEDAATRIGAKFTNWRFGFSRISRNGQTIVVRGGELMLDSHLTLELMGNKTLVYQLMAEQGFAVPQYRPFTLSTLAKAKNFLNEKSGPIVVKPASGTGCGRGVTTGINDFSTLKKAAKYASRFCSDLVAEQQLEGHSYRLLFLNGIFLDAVRREQPSVTGDGKKTIRQLVKAQNFSRLNASQPKALSPLIIDHDARIWLRSIRLSPFSRLPEGQTVQIKRAVNQNSAAQNHNVRDVVHPQTIALAAKLVRNLDVTLAGIDVLCHDISVPLGPKNGLISEINTTPGLHHHYLLADSKTGNRVAETLLDTMFASKTATLNLNKESLLPTPDISQVFKRTKVALD